MGAESSSSNTGADAVFSIDQNLTITGWSQEAQQLLGFAADEVVGQRCADVMRIIHEHGEPVCVPGCEPVRCFRHCHNFSAKKCFARHKDGAWVPVSVASTVVPRQNHDSDSTDLLAVLSLNREEKNHDAPHDVRTLQVFTFGRFGLAGGGRGFPIEKWPRKQALTLLKILVTRVGRVVSGELLCDCLWPEVDERRGHERLKVTVYALRRELRAAGLSDDIIQTVGDCYLLRRDAVWLDVEAFENRVAEGADMQRRRNWSDALSAYGEAKRLYRGDFMEEDIHADWFAEDRYRLREVHLELLTNIAECHAARGHFAKAASMCRTILVTDPGRESVHRALMEHLVRCGHIDSAIAQFRHCKQILASEIGVSPMSETESLYRQIMSGKFPANATSS